MIFGSVNQLNRSTIMFIPMLQAGGNPLYTFAMIALIIVIFYFFLLRPQMKRQKELRKFQEGLSKGDRVVVAGGIFGKVAEVRDDSVIVEIDNDTKVRVLKNSVYRDAGDVAPPPHCGEVVPALRTLRACGAASRFGEEEYRRGIG